MTLGAAIFDVFGTVVDWRRGVAEAVAPALAARRLAVSPWDFADAWRAEYQPAMERIRSGDRGYVALDALHLENLGRVLDALGIAAEFDDRARGALNRAWERLPPWPDAVAGLAAIRAQGLLVAPCSNGSIGMMARLARHGGLVWDAVLGADVARGYKPEPEVYRRSVEALGLAAGEVMMVAAHNDDLRAARALGLATAFVPRPTEYGEDQVTDLQAEEDWDVVAPDLGALASALARKARPGA